MGVRAWIRALHMRERYISKLTAWCAEAQERIHRLEIAQREDRDNIAHLEARLERVARRKGGELGGRPPKATDLASVPHGDKAALRRAMGVVPGRPFNHQE